MHGLNHAVVRQLTFSPSSGEKVFLCSQPVKKSESHHVHSFRTLRLEDFMTLDSLNS
jgi:hypothetical protein